ncbi:MAG: hypothetical protein J0L80_07270 [Chitinophagales bacterium]|nr:hypothetical protein [Chitinophagales bacterium]
MRILYITMLLLFCTQVVLAQDTLKFKDGNQQNMPQNNADSSTKPKEKVPAQFTLQFKYGMLDAFPPLNIKGDTNWTTTSSSNGLTTKDKKALKDTLKNIVGRAIINIEDDSLKLKQFYEWLWDTVTVAKYIKEQQDLYFWLASNGKGWTTTYVPAGTEIDALLGMKKYADTAKKSKGNNKHIADVVKNDVYKQWILQMYDTSYTQFAKDLDSSNYIVNYIKGWEELEDAYKQLTKAKSELIAVQKEKEECDKIINSSKKSREEIIKLKGTNAAILHFSKHSNFYLKWLWYNEGVLSANPLYIVKPDREYPTNKPFVAMIPQMRELVAKYRLKGQQLLVNQQLYNRVELPFAVNEKRKRRELWHMLMTNAGIEDDKLSNKEKLLTEDDEMTLCVHNVKAGQELVVTFDTTAISDKGPFTDGMSYALDTVYNSFRAVLISAGLKNLVNSFTGTGRSMIMPEIRVSMGSGDAWMPDGSSNEYEQKSNREVAYMMEGKQLGKVKVKSTDTIAFVEGIAVKLHWGTNNQIKLDEQNKKALVEVYRHYNPESPLTEELMKSFWALELRNKKSIILDFNSQSILQTSVDSFFKRLNDYVEKMNICNDSIKAELIRLDTQIFYLAMMLQINERSLPPTGLVSEDVPEDAVPQYSTRIYEMPVKARSKIAYNVTLKQTKKINDKDTVLKTTLYKSSYKVGGLYRFMPSAGVAYIFPQYTNNVVNKGSNNIVASVDALNPRIMAIVGLNVYPSKYYSLDGRGVFKTFCKAEKGGGGFRYRYSLFAGLGIVNGKALEHFYVGPSLDFYTGLKLTAGAHLYKYTRYEINNNQVLGIHPSLKCNYFMGVTVDPALFVKFFNVFN